MREHSGEDAAAGSVLSAARARKAITVLMVGLVSGVSLLIGEIALVTLVFSGDLAPYLSQGIGLLLFGILAGCVVIALVSGFLGAVCAPAVATMLMLGVIGSSLTATGDALFPTMVAVIVVCSLATAASALLIAHFKLANLVRFIPYPVSSGFLAGTGGIACWLALSLMGIRPEAEALAMVFEPLVAANWGVGIAYGFGLYFATQRWNGILLMPVSFAVVAGLCHIGLMVSGTSGAEAGAAGFLFAGLPDATLWPPVTLDDAARVDWTAIALQVPNILTLVLVTLLCVVIYTGGLEVASNRELDWNREFRAIGLGGALAGLGGGPPSCPVVPASLRNIMFQVDLRSTGVIAGLAMASPLLFGDAVFRLVPVPLMGGVLLFTGLALLDEWLLKVRKRVPPVDYAVIVAMLVTIVLFGFFEGMALGMAIVVIAFVVRMSRAGVVDSTFTAREVRSKSARSVPDRVILQTEGARARGYRLKGYLFFGGGQPLADRLKASLDEDPRPLCVLLDLTAVTGFDFSSVNAMCRFILAARGAGTEVIMAAAPDRLADELRRNLPPPVYAALVFAADCDRALEHCEESVIEAYGLDGDTPDSRAALLRATAPELEQRLDRQALFEDLIDRLEGWFDRREYAAGETLLAAGEPIGVLQLVTGGSASVHDEAGARVRMIRPGDAVAAQLPSGTAVAAAMVVAETTCTAAALSPPALQLLEESDRHLALQLYRYLLDAESKDPGTERPGAGGRG